MRFRLHYEGQLRTAKEEPWDPSKPAAIDRRADHKHSIRREFHQQLKELWEHDKWLREGTTDGTKLGKPTGNNRPLVEAIPDALPTLGGFSFVPLVCRTFDLLCKIDVLMLRRDEPGRGGIISHRDLDNRLKILFDALKMPRDMAELGDNVPQEGENPLFVLVQADELITHVSIETGTLFGVPPEFEFDESYVHLLVTVTVSPYNVDMWNLSYAGG